jgi:DNA-binding response OmpR family regulator
MWPLGTRTTRTTRTAVAPRTEAAEPTRGEADEPARVLLLERGAVGRRLARVTLESAGFEVAIVQDLPVAAEHLEVLGLRLMVVEAARLDLHLRSFLRCARGRRPDLPILVVVDGDSVAERVAGLEAGADDCVGKPVSVAELRARLAVQLRRYEAARHGAGRPAPRSS